MTSSSTSALLACLLLAGCAAAPPHASPAPPVDPPRPTGLELSGCTGWDAVSTPLPGAAAPGQAPPGWEPRTNAMPSVILTALACSRLALGPFERPVRLLLETHERATPPPACWGNLPYGIVASVWVDDVEVAGYLVDRLGLPAHATRFEEAPGPAPGLRTWTWGDPAARSSLTLDGQDAAAVGGPQRNLLWPRGDGIGRLTLALHADSPLESLPTTGTMQPPMLLAGSPGGAFTGTAYWYPHLTASGALALFKDRSCLEPA
ncbi:MAG: hypothetical protein QOI63_1919 [Thermoplasmata archaeon]|nr:hypothetical protein [Thermoplasmata archaeon]